MLNTGSRLKDIIFSLSIANKYNENLGKLQLQKLIYLSDTLFPLWNSASLSDYENYKHGPYDINVQNAVDVLAFRGAVNIVDYKILSQDKTQINYQLSKNGKEVLRSLLEEQVLAKKYELYELLGYQIEKRGWKNLKKLVYSEPTYVSMKSRGFGYDLKLDSFYSNVSIRIVKTFENLIRDPAEKLSKKNLVGIFFQVLDNYLPFNIS